MSDGDFSAAAAAAAAAASSAAAPKARGGSSGKHRGPRFTWNPQYEETFFRSLCESVSLGLRDGSTFKPEAWERAMQALIEKHNAYANKGHLINKTDNARKKYRLWRGLREDPEFYYNAQTRMVTATDDAWARHLQKEPLARSLRARPFEHEEYYEILFPDVIGSGGAPKRLTKQRRKAPETVNTTEEQDAPGTAIMDLLTDSAYINQTHMPPPLPPAAMTAPMPAHPAPTPQQHSRAPATTMPPPPPQRTSISSASALTPPEETGMQTRKRLHGSDSSSSAPNHPPDKRRRAGPPGYLDLTQQQQQNPNAAIGTASTAPAVTAPTSSPAQASVMPPTAGAAQPLPPQPAQAPTTAATTTTTATLAPSIAAAPAAPVQATLSDALHLLADALRASTATTTATPTPTPTTHSSIPATVATIAAAATARGAGGARSSWPEQAMDIFFRDFAGEDMDLQLKIAEKVLGDENKAMVFCKMPDALRRHWVKRLREVHNRIA